MKIINAIIKYFFILVFLTWPPFLLANSSKLADTASFLTVSDIHFNPFYTCDPKSNSCLIIDKLKNAPASAWEKNFEQFDKKAPRYGEDTNYVLFRSSLAALKKQGRENQVGFVLVLGDFLSHDYKKNYQRYTGDTSPHGIQIFVDKTMQFITSTLRASFPDKNVYMVVGNNDAYGVHYTSTPVFYKNIAPIWSELIKDEKTRAVMEKDFRKGGYYAVTLPSQKNLRLIVLNTTYFSSRGVNLDHEAQTELQWLEEELNLLAKNNQKALIALHIPIGESINKTILNKIKIIGLWKQAYTQCFLELLKKNSTHIMAILPGHIHLDWFQIIPFSNKAKAILVTATPAISPVIGNNPGFKVYQYDPQHLLIADYKTFYAPLEGMNWQLEYDFNQVFQPHCKTCDLIQGISQIQKTEGLADYYKNYFTVKRDIEAAEKETFWIPYFWKALNSQQVVN